MSQKRKDVKDETKPVNQTGLLNAIAQDLFAKVRRMRYVVFLQNQRPYRQFARTCVAGCVNPCSVSLPAAGTLKEIGDAMADKPIDVEGEKLHFKEMVGDFLIAENPLNEWCNRAAAFKTHQYFVFLFFTRCTAPLNLPAEIKAALQVVQQKDLDQVTLTDKPQNVAPPIITFDPNDEGIMFRKVRLAWALRTQKYTLGQDTCVVTISLNHLDIAWRVQELLQLIQKFQRVYFILDIPQLQPETYGALASLIYYLDKVNIVWHAPISDQSFVQAYQKNEYLATLCNPDGSEQYITDNMDQLYDHLCETHFKNSDPDPAPADVFFQKIHEGAVVYMGVPQLISNVEQPIPVTQKKSDEEQRQQHRKRRQFMTADPAKLDEEEKDDEEEEGAVKAGQEDQQNDDQKLEGEDENEETKKPQFNHVCVFLNPKLREFKELLETVIVDQMRFKHVIVFVCLYSSNQLNIAQFKSKISNLDSLKILFDTNNFYQKVAGDKAVFYQMFNKDNKLLLETTDYSQIQDVILKREPKKAKLEREEYERKMEAQLEMEQRKQKTTAGLVSSEGPEAEAEGKKKRKRQPAADK